MDMWMMGLTACIIFIVIPAQNQTTLYIKIGQKLMKPLMK